MRSLAVEVCGKFGSTKEKFIVGERDSNSGEKVDAGVGPLD